MRSVQLVNEVAASAVCVCALFPAYKPTIQNAIPTTIMHNQTNLLTHPHTLSHTHTHKGSEDTFWHFAVKTKGNGKDKRFCGRA